MRFVYFIRAKNSYKIGVATNLKKRLSSIQTGNGEKIELICAKRCINALKLESEIHTLLKKYGGNGGREWFNLTPTEALKVAVRINKNPEAETADLIIQDLQLDLKTIIDSYWAKLEKHISKPPEQKVIIKPVTKADNEDLINRAIIVIRNNNRASTSLLQRDLGIGYSKASRLMNELEAKGIVGGYNGAKARTILI